jgi:FkbM family methyltransferase
MTSFKIRREIMMVSKFILAFGFIQGLWIYLRWKQKPTMQFAVPGIAHPFTLRKDPTDRKVFYELFVDLNYHFLDLIGDAKVIFDCGANIGLNAIICKNRFPAAQIICIEPDDQNVEALRTNTLPYKNIHIEKGGLWNKHVKLRVYDKYGIGKSGIVVEEDDVHGTIMGLTIPLLMEKHNLTHIDLLKVDIETSEKQVFSDHYMEWLPKVKAVLIETHDRMTPGCAQSFFKAAQASFPEYALHTYGDYLLVLNTGFAEKN